MKTASLLSRFKKEKIGVSVNKNRYLASHRGYVVTWHDQEGFADCVRMRREDDKDDIYSDYCAGWFVRSIKDIFNEFARN